MDNLTVEQVITFHRQIMENEGGDDRLLSEAGLHQIVFSANQIGDSYQKAALILFFLIAYPAFRDGNSRTARLVAEKILSASSCVLETGENELTDLVQGITGFTIEQADVEVWLRSHSQKTGLK